MTTHTQQRTRPINGYKHGKNVDVEIDLLVKIKEAKNIKSAYSEYNYLVDCKITAYYNKPTIIGDQLLWPGGMPKNVFTDVLAAIPKDIFKIETIKIIQSSQSMVLKLNYKP